MRDAIGDIVAAVIEASPEIAPTVDSLAAVHRREVQQMVRRDGVTPEAALAVLRGRRQLQRDALAHRALTDQITEGIR